MKNVTILKWAHLSDASKNLLEWVENPYTGKKQTISVPKTNVECMSYLKSKEAKSFLKIVSESTTDIHVALK